MDSIIPAGLFKIFLVPRVVLWVGTKNFRVNSRHTRLLGGLSLPSGSPIAIAHPRHHAIDPANQHSNDRLTDILLHCGSKHPTQARLAFVNRARPTSKPTQCGQVCTSQHGILGLLCQWYHPSVLHKGDRWRNTMCQASSLQPTAKVSRSMSTRKHT